MLTGVGMLLVYAMRTNVAVTAIALLDEELIDKVGTDQAADNLPDVNWNTRKVGFLHSIFYMGYLIAHIPGGYLTTVCPSHRIFGSCILFSAVLNFALPSSIADLPYYVPCLVRFVQGLGEGLLYPACYAILRHWTTQEERGRTVAAVLTGSFVGPVVGFPLAGFLTHNYGWQYVYYICGSMCVVWYLFWLIFAYEKPSHSRWVSDSELEYIEIMQGDDTTDYENIMVPWKAILTSLPVLALCACHFARYWIHVLTLTNEPFFLHLFQFTIQENGLLSSIPPIAKVAMSLFGGWISDFLLVNGYVSTTHVRKILTSVGYGGGALFFLLLTFTNTGWNVIFFLVLALGCFGFSVAGWQINHYDLATRYAGILVSVTSAFGSIAAIMAPLVVGELTINEDKEGWDNVFYVTCAIIISALIVYLVFGSGIEQSWGQPPVDIKLIHRVDPLARRPYAAVRQQPNSKMKNIAFAPKDKSMFKQGQKRPDTETGDSNKEIPSTQLLHRLSRKLKIDTPEHDI